MRCECRACKLVSKERRLPAVEGIDGWEAVTPCAPAVMPPSIRLAKSIAPELRLQRLPLLRSAANRSSKAFPICNRPAARAKAPKQDAKPGFLQDSPTAADRRWLPKNIGGRNSPARAPRHRFRPIFAAEIANLRGAISEDQCADRKAARFFSRSEKSSLHRENASGSSGAGKLLNVSSSVSDKNGASNSARPLRIASRTAASPTSAKNRKGLDAPNSWP